jgi:hypothetical protein
VLVGNVPFHTADLVALAVTVPSFVARAPLHANEVA